MKETSIPLHRLLSAVLWSITGLLLVVGWSVYIAGLADLAVLLVATAGPFALGAATATSRCWAVTVARLVRLSAGGPVLPERPIMRSVPDWSSGSDG